jgi:predicted nucleic acid-binding protein
MILVDTSVWIDHLHRTVPELNSLLAAGRVVTHSFVIGELALGSIPRRREVLDGIRGLRLLPTISESEAEALVEVRALHGQGLGLIDIHLLGAVLIVPGATLWSRDKRLAKVAAACGTAHRET